MLFIHLYPSEIDCKMKNSAILQCTELFSSQVKKGAKVISVSAIAQANTEIKNRQAYEYWMCKRYSQSQLDLHNI